MFIKDIHIESLYTELGFTERFAAAKKDGFDYIEFWNWEDKDLPEVKKLLSKNDLKMATMSGDGPYSMCDPANKKIYIEYIEKAIKAAEIINCPLLVIHSDSLEDNPQFAKPMSGDYSDLRRWCAMFDVLRIITPMAENAGVTFVLEALNTVKDHCGNFLASTQNSADLVESIGSNNLKILYDAYHMYLNEGKISETVEKFLPHIGHIHIADAPGRHEPGTGVINYKNFLQILGKLNYQGSVGFELYASSNTATAINAIKNCF